MDDRDSIPLSPVICQKTTRSIWSGLEWNGDRFRKWAKQIGPIVYEIVDALLTSGRVEQQSYRSCMGLLKLAEKHSPQKLEAACMKVLSYSSSPNYKSIKNLLVTLKDDDIPKAREEKKSNSFGITRGARYYGGKRS